MALKTGMLVGIAGTDDIGVLIQIRSASNTCVIKLNKDGTLRKNVPLEDVEEARDMADTKEKRSPIRLTAEATRSKSPTKLAALSIDTDRDTGRLSPTKKPAAATLDVGDPVRARCNGGSRWFPGKIQRVRRDGTYDIEYNDGDVEQRVRAEDVEALASSLRPSASSFGASPPLKKLGKTMLAVGDKVKARYGGGSKLFSGEIVRVRLDGTYDINYDDGDSETRVAEALIEATRPAPSRGEDDDEDDDRRRSGVKAKGFHVNQAVKAHYKRGKKLFPGKIKKVHADGSCDIKYDDGDEEKRVKAELIEAVGDPESDHEDDRRLKREAASPRTSSKTEHGAGPGRKKALAVGRKVKARYRKGKRLFAGKITRVRSDGSYDIIYEDGDVETRVDRSLIEVSDDDDDEEDLFADSGDDKAKDERATESKTKLKASWQVGDRVKAYYGKGKRLFPGRITKVHLNGTYDIAYDDGDSEVRVSASLIDGSPKSSGAPLSSSKTTHQRLLRVGDHVKAKYKRGTKYFPGRITRVHSDGTYDIKYEDGDSETRVEATLVEPVKTADDDDFDVVSRAKKSGSDSFEVGDVVKAPFQRSKRLFRGKISRVRTNGTYDIAFDDGDRDTQVPAELIQREEGDPGSPRSTLKKSELQVGDSVKARYKKGRRLLAGTIARVRSDGTYDVEYDDGDVEKRIDREFIEVPEKRRRGRDEDDEPRAPVEQKRLAVGDKVRARYKGGRKLFNGEITAVHRDGTYDIRYEDGDREKFVAANNIEMENVGGESDRLPGKSQTGRFKSLAIGDHVQANYKNGIKLYDGKIARVHSDGTYDIKYADGDSERRVERSRIKVKNEEEDAPQPKKKAAFAVGDVIKARYKRGTKLFGGKISRVRLDGTYDIDYDDGDKEMRVEADLIVATETDSPKGGDDTPPKISDKKRFKVGDAVKARYRKGPRLFAGKISRVHLDGTYDIDYADGDKEIRVDKSLIEAEEDEDSRGSRDAADSKSKTGFAVGDKVKARYKRGLKWYPGKITRARLDGTFDILFDDGDQEMRVNSSSIESVPDSKAKKSKLEAKADSDEENLFADSDSDKGGRSSKSKKKEMAIKVGDVVEANFKSKGKFRRGKVVRVRSDGTFDVEYDVGTSEKRVAASDIKPIGRKQNDSDDSTRSDNSHSNSTARKTKKLASSDSDEVSSTRRKKKKRRAKKARVSSSSDSSGTESITTKPIQKGARVTLKVAEDDKARRIGIVQRVHSNGSCDVKYEDGDISKRIDRKSLLVCSDSESSSDDEDSETTRKKQRGDNGATFRRNQRVLASWRRASKLSKPRKISTWAKATVLESHGDGTYTVRYKDGVVEEDAPAEALKSRQNGSKREEDFGSGGSSDASSSSVRKKRHTRSNRAPGISTESLFLLEQLAMTLFEEGSLKKKPKLLLAPSGSGSSSSDASSSSSEASESGSKQPSKRKSALDKVLRKLFGASSLQTYRHLFNEKDTKASGKISGSKIIAIVGGLCSTSHTTGDCGEKLRSSSVNEDQRDSVKRILTEWFATHEDLRVHRHFEFKTLMLAFAYTKHRLGKMRIEQTVATVLEGRFASYHEHKRQLELWQQKLGFRLFETLQRLFHDRALPNMIPSRIRVSELPVVLDQVARNAMPNKPIEVYLQQQQLLPHHTILLPEFMCCYYQLYGSASENAVPPSWGQPLELRPVAFVASCLFSNGDTVCKRHGDLVRRLSVGRTPAQLDLILRFREAFEALLNTEGSAAEESLLSTSQLAAFAARVVPDTTVLEPAVASLRKRSAAVSLVEVFGSCGFVIDELTSAPTIGNAIEKLRMRVEVAEVRRILGLIRNICLKILRFPNNADYWRIRADSPAFQQKLGRFDGATSLLEAVGFVEYHKTHFELRGARGPDGKRVSALEKATLDALRDKCVQLDGELSLLDGVESLSSIFQRVAQEFAREGSRFTLDECQDALKHLSVYIGNVLKNPKDSRCWRIREVNATFQRQIGGLPFAVELMESIGFDLVRTSQGNAYMLRGTGPTELPVTKQGAKPHESATQAASLSNFRFSSVSSQTEWFLWRRKQEIDSLLGDEMQYLHDLVGRVAPERGAIVANGEAPGSRDLAVSPSDTRDAAFVKLYPYGTNAVDIFNTTSVQQRQLTMMRQAFDAMDIDQKGFLLETDFSRTHGPPATLPFWARFDAFDIGKDGKVDFPDFVAALGPMLDHSYDIPSEASTNRTGTADDGVLTLCEATSSGVGSLRLGTSCIEAAAVLELLLSHMNNIVQEPGKQDLWVVSDTTPLGSKLLRLSACRELLRLMGFRDCADTVTDTNSDKFGRAFELQPQKLRFKTSKAASDPPQALDQATVTKIQTVASMLAGHYRGLEHPTVSDVSAVSRAISAKPRRSERWVRLVELAVKCLANVLKHPDNDRYRELNTSTDTYTNNVANVQGGPELLMSVGFRETDTGTLAIPADTPLEVLEARSLELEVGLELLLLDPVEVEPQERRRDFLQSNQGSKHRTPVPRDTSGAKNSASVHQVASVKLAHRSQSERRPHQRQGIAPRNQPRATKATTGGPRRRVMTKAGSERTRPSSLNDSIEMEILSTTSSHHKQRLGNRAVKSRGQDPTRKRDTPSPNREYGNRKQAQWRSPSMPPPSNGHAMVLTADVNAGCDTVVVRKGMFVQRGALVRVGAELRDLDEERVVVEVTNSEGAATGLTTLRLSSPLRFFHCAKELVSPIPLPSAQTAAMLELSDLETVAREIIDSLVKESVCRSLDNSEACYAMAELRSTQPATIVVDSFDCIGSFELNSIYRQTVLRVGSSMQYAAVWGRNASSTSGSANCEISIVRDLPSDRKLKALWEGLVLQAGASSAKVRLKEVRQIAPQNPHLALLLSMGSQVSSTWDRLDLSSKRDEFQMGYSDFRAFLGLAGPGERDATLPMDAEEDAPQLLLPLAYLRKHFQVLSKGVASFSEGYQCVDVCSLLHRVLKDIQERPPVVSDDPQVNQAGLKAIQDVCTRVEKAFGTQPQVEPRISWPQLVYFVRHNARLATPELFPLNDREILATTAEGCEETPNSSFREVAEIITGMHGSELFILRFDGTVELWDVPSRSSAQCKSRTLVLFSTKSQAICPREEGSSHQAAEESSRQTLGLKSFMEAWVETGQRSEEDTAWRRQQGLWVSGRIHRFKRTSCASEGLLQLCALDSVLCVNSSILGESSSGSFRFFRIVDSTLSPIRQISVTHRTIEPSVVLAKREASIRKPTNTATSSVDTPLGMVKGFAVTSDGSKVVFHTAKSSTLWVICAGTGDVLGYVDGALQNSCGKAQVLFQLADNRIATTGKRQTRLFATTTTAPKTHQRIGMWLLPGGGQSSGKLQRKMHFVFGDAKVQAVSQLAVVSELVLAASKDGAIVVWSTASGQAPPVAPLTYLRIPVRGSELLSICCRTFGEFQRKNGDLFVPGTIPIQTGGSTAAEIDRWEHSVLQCFDSPPLRFAVYLFDDGEIIRVSVSETFDARLVTLDDPGFEQHVFFPEISAASRASTPDRATRVVLQKHCIVRIAFVALHYARDGVFAQKSVQEFFEQLTVHEVLWKTRARMRTFAASYRKSVAVELQVFYRQHDGVDVELMPPHRIPPENIHDVSEGRVVVVVLGATVKNQTTGQTRFQTWKLAVSSIGETDGQDGQSVSGRLQYARQALALQSAYILEAQRLLRTRRDCAYEEHAAVMKQRRSRLIGEMESEVCEMISRPGQAETTAEDLLRGLHVLKLASLDEHPEQNPVERYFQLLFDSVSALLKAQADTQGQNKSRGFAASISALDKVLDTEASRRSCFVAWVRGAQLKLRSYCRDTSEGSITWTIFSLLIRHLQTSMFTTDEVALTLLELGLVAMPRHQNEGGIGENFASSSALPLVRCVEQLQQFLNKSRQSTDPAQVSLDVATTKLLSPSMVVEFIFESINFSHFFCKKVDDLTAHTSSLDAVGQMDSHSSIVAQTKYALQLKTRQWQQQLQCITRLHNQLQTSVIQQGPSNALQSSPIDAQRMKQLLRAPLPPFEPGISSIVLKNRCDAVHIPERLVMNASGRLTDGDGTSQSDVRSTVLLSVVYVFMGNDEDTEKSFQQELTLLRKLQHQRAREFFLPVCFSAMNVPIVQPPQTFFGLPLGESEGTHCLVTESLHGWVSLADCVAFTRVPGLPLGYWQSLVWFWSQRMLLSLVALQNERFLLSKRINLKTVVVSDTGCELRLCSLAGGGFQNADLSEDELISNDRAMARVFGEFVFELVQNWCLGDDTFSNETHDGRECLLAGEDGSIDGVVNGDEGLSEMRKQLVRTLMLTDSDICGSSGGDELNVNGAVLTEFSDVLEIATFEVKSDLAKLCRLALLALQPASDRPDLQSLCGGCGGPDVAIPEADKSLVSLAHEMMALVGLQRQFRTQLLRYLRLYSEQCKESHFNDDLQDQAVCEWVGLLQQLFLSKPGGSHGVSGGIGQTKRHVLASMLQQVIEAHVPQQLFVGAMNRFIQCSRNGDGERGRHGIQSLLQGLAHVLGTLDASATTEELHTNPLLQMLLDQVLDCLRLLTSGRTPPCHARETLERTPARMHKDGTGNAVLWRLSEPLFKVVLGVEGAPSKYQLLLGWLSARQASLGYSPALAVKSIIAPCGSDSLENGAQSAQPGSQPEIGFWWSDHAPTLPRLLAIDRSPRGSERRNALPENPTSARYLRCIYETLEIDFKLSGGVHVPKFRLAALHQWFGPTFFDRRRCFPMVFVRPLVATVWRDLCFDRLLCRLLRDGDEQIVLGSLSLLECSTRIFRFNPLSCREREAPSYSASTNMSPSSQTAYMCSRPERDFALSLCSQNVVAEVKRVLDRTTRALKVLGESGSTSGSHNQHPLVSTLSVTMAWLTNCLHGGDAATQFWGPVGLDQLIVVHAKAESLPFVKIRDANMINQVFRQAQRLATQSGKWDVFSSAPGDDRSSRWVLLPGRNSSPFRMMLDEIVIVGSSRCIVLLRTMLLSRTFRQEVGLIETTKDPSSRLALQCDLLSSRDYGRVSHAVDLASDIAQFNGTTDEQVQLIEYTRALFFHHKSTASSEDTASRRSALAPVCREIWCWMKTAWRTVVEESSNACASSHTGICVRSRSHSNVVTAGFALLHAIVTHPSISVEELAELSTFAAVNAPEEVNVLQEIASWIGQESNGTLKFRLPHGNNAANTLSVLVECAVALLVNPLRSRRYDTVALAMVTKCTGVRALLGLLGLDRARPQNLNGSVDTADALLVEEKQRLWSTLLFFDSRTITSCVLETEFLGIAVMARLLPHGAESTCADTPMERLNQRLEGVMFLELLVCSSCSYPKSVNTQLLLAEICKLLLHHQIISREAQCVRLAAGDTASAGSSDSQLGHGKRVAVAKRLMQLVCCLCVDFASQQPSRVFLEHLNSVGVPEWVVLFHQKLHAAVVSSENANQQLAARVELFWKDWQGGDGGVRAKRLSTAVSISEASRKSVGVANPPPNIAVTPRGRTEYSSSRLPEFKTHRASQSRAHTVLPTRLDVDPARVKVKRPTALVSPVKLVQPVPKPRGRRREVESGHAKDASTAKASVVQTLLSIDAESALQLAGHSAIAAAQVLTAAEPNKAKARAEAQELVPDALESDAYSSFPSDSTSEGEATRTRGRTRTKAARKRMHSSKKKHKARRGRSSDAKLSEECKMEPSGSSRSSSSSSSRSNSRRSNSRSSSGQCSSSSDSTQSGGELPRRRRGLAGKPSATRQPTARVSPPAPASAQELQREALHAVFRKYDVDGDGAISFIDLRRALGQQAPVQLSDLEIQQWIMQKDRSGQGVVLLEDFVRAFAAQPSVPDHQQPSQKAEQVARRQPASELPKPKAVLSRRANGDEGYRLGGSN